MLIFLSGPTCSGKTTIAAQLVDLGVVDVVIAQDAFYLTDPAIFREVDGFENWDDASVFEYTAIDKEITSTMRFGGTVLVEGLCFPDHVSSVPDFLFRLTCPHDELRRRRFARDEWIVSHPQYWTSCALPFIEAQQRADGVVLDATRPVAETVQAIRQTTGR